VKTEFVEQGVWDGIWQATRFTVAPPEDDVRRWIAKHASGGSGSCLELGCFPGRYLAVFGELGYELHGVDRTPRVQPEMREWLTSRAYRVGELARADVFTHTFGRQYDVVCSLGLIEHFGEWPKLIQIHADLVRPGGLLMLETPNFRGWVQQLLHRCFDGPSLRQHNLDAMRPQQWAEIIRPLGFEIVECGWFGAFDWWIGSPRTSWCRDKLTKALMLLNQRCKPLTRHLPPGVAAYAPYAGLVARRRLSSG
jgi:SAM-dependent methyltransferase